MQFEALDLGMWMPHVSKFVQRLTSASSGVRENPGFWPLRHLSNVWLWPKDLTYPDLNVFLYNCYNSILYWIEFCKHHMVKSKQRARCLARDKHSINENFSYFWGSRSAINVCLLLLLILRIRQCHPLTIVILWPHSTRQWTQPWEAEVCRGPCSVGEPGLPRTCSRMEGMGLGLNCAFSPDKTDKLKSYIPQNMTWYGDEIFTKVIKLQWGH